MLILLFYVSFSFIVLYYINFIDFDIIYDF
jgi:hypothetical protein